MADPELPYAQVIHRVLGVGADTDADADLHPDLSVLAGLTVTFTPQPSVIKWLGAGGPVTHPNKVVTGVYDSQGYLRLTQDSAQEGVWLLASSHEDMVPSGWTYTAKWSLNAIPAVPFHLSPGSVIDLTTVIPVPSNPGSQLTDWLAAVEAAQAAQAAAEAAAEGVATGVAEAEAAADRAEAARDETEATIISGLTWTGAVSLATYADRPYVLRATLTGNTTITLPTPVSPGRALTLTLRLAQDATGGRTVVIKGASAAWSAAYAHTGTANSVDVIHLLWLGTAWIALPAALNVGVPTSWAV